MSDHVEQLAHVLGEEWKHIHRCREAGRAKLSELQSVLEGCGSIDAAILAFGSLARLELTESSDLDWTLLVDGPAQRDQRSGVHQIARALQEHDEIAPNKTGAFGSMSFSHELVHRIGGEADTNRITTQRVLLLLESTPIGPESSTQVHRRVLRSVVDSYLGDDEVSTRRVPYLLLNDVVRYWRTVTVDFAGKARERGNQGWAIRNLKLRTSRKLIFAAGLVVCLGRVPEADQLKRADLDQDSAREALLAELVDLATLTPLDTLAKAVLAFPGMQDLLRPVLCAYDEFLGLMSDNDRRSKLASLNKADALESQEWEDARLIGRAFGKAIEELFFSSKSRYHKAIRTYGLF